MYKALIMFFVSITTLIPLSLDRAFGLDCPKPPEQAKKEWEIEVNLAVLKIIGPIKGGEIEVKVRDTTNDLLSKLPDAAWVYLETMMYSGYCSALRDDKTITEFKKAQLIREYNSVVRNTIDAKLNPQQKAQAEMLRQATAETVRRLSDVSRKATAEIQETLLDIKQRHENCMEANTAYTHKKLEDLNKSLVKLYSQRADVPDEDAKEWALETLENAREFKKEMEKLDELRKEYNKELSKNLIANAYMLFDHIFQTVDSRVMAFQKLKKEIKYHKAESLNLFGDESNPIKRYTFRTILFPKGNRILIDCVMGELKQGIVSTCPSLVFTEIVERKEMHSFKIAPQSGGNFILSEGGGVPLKKERALKDVEYPASGGELLTKQFKRQFDQTFKEFFMIAYAR